MPDAEEVKPTDSPSQNVVAPDADIVGIAGSGLTVTTAAAEAFETHPFAFVV